MSYVATGEYIFRGAERDERAGESLKEALPLRSLLLYPNLGN